MGFFSSLLCMFGGIFCISYYCKRVKDNLDEEVIIVKIKRSDLVDENGIPIVDIPPEYTLQPVESIIPDNNIPEQLPLLENPPVYDSNLANRTNPTDSTDSTNPPNPPNSNNLTNTNSEITN